MNTSLDIRSINETGGLCNSLLMTSPCNPLQVVSMGLYKDTLYYVGYHRELYRVKLGTVSSGCTPITILPSTSDGIFLNSLEVSRDGIVYVANAETRELYRYNPYTQVTTTLGVLNVMPGGDLIFYHDKLLLATMSNGVYEVNINDPGSSTAFIDIPPGGPVFYGLLAVPFDCNNNKYYGLQWNGNFSGTNLYELDMENHQVLGITCTLPFLAYDAASSVSNGNTVGITIDQVHVQPACGNGTLAEITVSATTGGGDITYTLDGTLSNQTGIFTGVTQTVHTLHIQNSMNCSRDTVISVAHGLLPEINIDKRDPYCLIPNGRITVTATSGYGPVQYSIDGNNFGTGNIFTNLTAGPHTVSIKDAAGCAKDTVIILTDSGIPSFFTSIDITPTTCISKNGSIQVQLAAGINAADVTVSLNSSTPQSSLSFTQLDSGQYQLHLVYQNICMYDTVVKVLYTVNPSPQILVSIADQKCTGPNGAAGFSINGDHAPYLVNFNNAGNSTAFSYPGLAPGSYPVLITDRDGCFFDSSIIIRPYNTAPANIGIEKTDPDCSRINNGRLTVHITGSQGPYIFTMSGSTYNNDIPVTGLSEGDYRMYIFNSDHCFVDSSFINLAMTLLPECDKIYVPSAFTPDNDGLNDIFRAHAGATVNDFEMLIYNRAGQLVFSSVDKNKGWDGKLNGVIQSAGAYVWVIRYNSLFYAQKKLLKGTLSLIR